MGTEEVSTAAGGKLSLEVHGTCNGGLGALLLYSGDVAFAIGEF